MVKSTFFTSIPWRFILKLFLVLRVLTILWALLGMAYLPFKPSFPYADAILEPYGHPLLWAWANFDGVHYLMLAEKGYEFGLTQAFFPAYFLLIRGFNILIQNRLIAGLLISHVAFLAALGLLYKLVRLDFSDAVAKRVLIVLALFPTSFYFLSVYTESLFLCLLLGSFYLIRIKAWKYAGLLGIVLTATRIVGVFVVPAILYEQWQQSIQAKKENQTFYQNSLRFLPLLWSLVPLLGIGAYMWYLGWKFDDPVLFAHVQSGFGAGRDTSRFILPYQVIWRYLKMFATVPVQSFVFFTIVLEFISSLGFLGLTIWGFIKKQPMSYILFSITAWLLPTLTGTFSSMPRYVLILFPAFILLGQIEKKWLWWVMLAIFVILQAVATALFIRGIWIS